MSKLFIVEGGQETVFELLGDEVTIGRGAANAIQISDTHAGKHHAVIRTFGGRPRLIDLESKNGTRVNGHFRNQRVLEHGDTIAIGTAVLRYDGAHAAAAVAPRVPVPVAAATAAGHPAAPASPYAAPVVGHASSRASARRRDRERDRDRDDDDGERDDRRYARRSGSGAGIGILVGLGVLLVILGMFLLISNLGGTSKNALALAKAKEIARTGNLRGAITVLEREADPSDEDGYVSVARQLKTFRNEVANEAEERQHKESVKVFKDDIHYPYIEQHKNKLEDSEIARRIRDFLVKYKGTPTAFELENSPYPPYKELRELLQRVEGAPAMR